MPAVLNEVVNITVLKLKVNKADSEKLRQELSSYRFESPDEGRYQQLRDLFEGYRRKGRVEKFYGKCYAIVAENSDILQGFDPQCSNGVASQGRRSFVAILQ